MLLLVLAIAALAGAAFLIGEILTQPVRERVGSMQRASLYGRTQMVKGPVDESLRIRALVPLKEKIARAVLRVNRKYTIEQISFRLLGAGLGRSVSPTGFLAAKGVLGVTGLVIGIVMGASSSGLSAILFAAAFGGIGFIGPDFFVSQRIRSRRENIRAQLPDALDLLAVSVEAGMGFDSAVAKLVEQMDGPLIEEFELTLSEMRIGETRQVALKKMAERVGTPEISGFVRALVQADQFGISLGRILRVQAADTRLRRQAAAEERAMKAPIKMLFPTVMFIFPAMFIVILGPAIINISKIFTLH
jgi:tight adherence protein C